jgi:hypothetical protein
MKLQTIFRLLTIATGLLGGSFTHPAIALAKRGALSAQRCCDSEAVATLGASAQIAHSIPPQQTSPIVLATAYTDLTHIPHPQLSQGWLGPIEADNWCRS